MSHHSSPASGSSTPLLPPTSENRRRSRSRRQHRSPNHVFETAFVSSGLSSTEDLDEVDRIANHPLLQQAARLAAGGSTDEMGGSVDRSGALSSAAAFMDRRAAAAKLSASVSTSPVSWAGGGVNRMSRSVTLHTVAVTGSPQDSRGGGQSWGSAAFFPFSRPRAALTRIMRLRKPQSCDNILDSRPKLMPHTPHSTDDYSPRSLRDPRPKKSSGFRMTTSCSVNNILFQRQGQHRRDEDDATERGNCHEETVTLADFPGNERAAAGALHPHPPQSGPGSEGGRKEEEKGHASIFKTCSVAAIVRKGGVESPAKLSDHVIPVTDSPRLVAAQLLCRSTVCTTASPKGYPNSSTSSPALYTQPVVCNSDSPRNSRHNPAPCLPPSSLYSSPIIQPVQANCNPLHSKLSMSPSVTDSPRNSPKRLDNKSLRLHSGMPDSPLPLCQNRLNSTDSPLGNEHRSCQVSVSSFSPRLCHSRATTASNSRATTASNSRATTASNSSATTASNSSATSTVQTRDRSPGAAAVSSTGGSSARATPVGPPVTAGWSSSYRGPPLLQQACSRLPTPPATAPAQKKVMHGSDSCQPYGRPARGFFASSDLDVSQVGGRSGSAPGRPPAVVAAAAAASERLPSSAESTPQKASNYQRYRLRPRRRLELQLKQKRYLSSSSSSCLSSWDSIESTTSSQGYESESSCPPPDESTQRSLRRLTANPSTSSSPQRPQRRLPANLSILSPISDKSGDQISPSTSELDQNANSSVTAASATTAATADNSHSAVLSPAAETLPRGDKDVDEGPPKRRPNLNLNLHSISSSSAETALKSLRTPDIQQYLNVPWDMPKLKKRLQHRRNKFCFSGQASSPEMSPQKTATMATAGALPRSPDVELILRCEIIDGNNSWSNVNNNNNNVDSVDNDKENETMVLSSGLMSTSDDFSVSKEESPPPPPPNSVLRPQHLLSHVSAPRPVRKAVGSATGFVSISSGRHSGLKLWLRGGGSDSGISMSSQELKEEELAVPWSMPKQHQRRPTPAVVHETTATPAVTPPLLSRPSLGRLNSDGSLEHQKDKFAGTSANESDDDRLKAESSAAAELDLWSLPFAMPKLERRLRGESGGGGSPPILARPSSLVRPSSLLRSSDESASAESSPLKREKPRLTLSLGLGQDSGGSDDGGGVRGGWPSVRKRPGLCIPASLGLARSVEVDTTIPLESQEWYHGILSKQEAESVLRRCAHEGSYLVRTSARADFSLAIKSARGFIHLKITREQQQQGEGEEGGGFRLGEAERTFPSVVDMVRHYSLNRLPIRGAEHLCLLTPATEELL